MTPYDRLTRYLNATGWLVPTDHGPAGGLWRHPHSELLLPVPNDLVEDGIDWQRLVERLALVEEAAITDVLARIDGPDSRRRQPARRQRHRHHRHDPLRGRRHAGPGRLDDAESISDDLTRAAPLHPPLPPSG